MFGADAVFESERSATGNTTVVEVVALLLATFESAVTLVMLAVLDSVPPKPFAVCTTSVNVALVPAENVPIVQVTVPVPPAAGVVHANVGPAFCVSETNVLLAGTVSVSDTVCASEGPLLVTTTVKVAF
jgi:hypothetical protein